MALAGNLLAMQRVLAATARRKELGEELDRIKDRHDQAKDTLADREESIQALIEEHEGDADGLADEADRLLELHKDRQRADEAFQAVDREKRSLRDQHRKATERVFEIIEAESADAGLFEDKSQAAKSKAKWDQVPLSDIMNEAQAAALELHGITDPKSLLKSFESKKDDGVRALVQAGELRAEDVNAAIDATKWWAGEAGAWKVKVPRRLPVKKKAAVASEEEVVDTSDAKDTNSPAPQQTQIADDWDDDWAEADVYHGDTGRPATDDTDDGEDEDDSFRFPHSKRA